MPDFSDFIVFVDESGDHGMTSIDPHYPIFSLAFCLFAKEEYATRVAPAVLGFKFRHFGHDQVILHEHEIRKTKGAFRFLTDAARRDPFFERRGEKEDRELETEFRRVCGGQNAMFARLPFDIVMADKRCNSAGLQLADLVARPIGRKVLDPDQPNRAYDILARKFRRDRWGGVRGWGLKVFP